MFRLSSNVCPFCESRALSKVISGKWQPSRAAATLQKRRPSRTQLSSTVKTGPRSPDRPARKSRNGPFNGMNVTAAPKSLHRQYERSRLSASEQKRISRGEKPKRDERDPMRALKMQRTLANVSYEKRNRIKKDIEELESFEQFELLPKIQESISSQALGGLEDVSPTPIQRLAIPALLGMGAGGRKQRRRGMDKTRDMQQFLLAAETGSGKTLAYLLPVIDAIKRAEADAKIEHEAERWETEQNQQRQRRNRLFEVAPPKSTDPDPSTARPKAIILLPTAELVDQVGALVKSLSHTVKFRSALLSAQFTGKMIRSRLFSTGGIDVVVTTPHLLHSISESDPNVLARVSHLVIDEADSLLDRSFREVTGPIIDRATPSLQQLILCSATIPRNLDAYLQKRFPSMTRLTTPNLHAIPRRVRLSVVDIDKVPFQGNRDLACAQIIWDLGKEGVEGDAVDGRTGKQVLVFVNEREKADELATYLKKKGIEAFALSRDSEERRGQMDLLSAFTGFTPMSTSPNSAANAAKKKAADDWTNATADTPADLPLTPLPSTIGPPPTAPSTKKSIPQVLVTTDIFSRGIDTRLLKDVILYDVPHTSIDFIHRMGRVGRMGRRGRAVVLVGRNDRKDIVKEIREAGFGGRALI